MQINLLKPPTIHHMGLQQSLFSRREIVAVKQITKRKLSKNHLKKSPFKHPLIQEKINLEALPCTTMKITLRMVKWIFVMIFIYIAISIIVLIIQGGDEQIRNILVYSVSGFFTFFMGYFGWMFARSVSEIVGGKKMQGDEL